ncbi:hypothetical protein CIB48_g8571 [Xylaria polymorpha]|nr:hypothetical protein CIB48_g8571 [Xylaria polymorpha]
MHANNTSSNYIPANPTLHSGNTGFLTPYWLSGVALHGMAWHGGTQILVVLTAHLTCVYVSEYLQLCLADETSEARRCRSRAVLSSVLFMYFAGPFGDLPTWPGVFNTSPRNVAANPYLACHCPPLSKQQYYSLQFEISPKPVVNIVSIKRQLVERSHLLSKCVFKSNYLPYLSLIKTRHVAIQSKTPVDKFRHFSHFKMCTRQILKYSCGHIRDMGIVPCPSPSTCGGPRPKETPYAAPCENH